MEYNIEIHIQEIICEDMYCVYWTKDMWEHPHSHLPIHRYASQHVSQCRNIHIITFQFAVIHHSNATSLSPILLSLRTAVSAHNSLHKRRFPSQLLTQHFRANSHAYQTCQPTNGRADEQRENHIKRPWFQPKDYSFITHCVARLVHLAWLRASCPGGY